MRQEAQFPKSRAWSCHTSNVQPRFILARSESRQKSRSLSRFGGLLEGIRKLDQCGLAPGTAEEGDSHRQARKKSRGHVDVGITRDRCGVRTAPGHVVAIDQVCEPRWPPRGSHNGVKMVLVHDRVDAFGPR